MCNTTLVNAGCVNVRLPNAEVQRRLVCVVREHYIVLYSSVGIGTSCSASSANTRKASSVSSAETCKLRLQTTEINTGVS